MAIEKVEIKNFTVFEDISIEMSKGINVFIGENGTGKTHLLKILYAMTDVTKYRTPFLGINEFEGNRAIISNNFDHLIYFLFNAPVDGLAVNLVRNKFTHQLESAKIVVSTDSETFTSYVAGLEFVAATSPSDMGDRAFGNESFFIPAKDMLSHSGIEGDFEKRLLPFDATQINILNDLRMSKLREQTKLVRTLTVKLSTIFGGKILYRNGGYFIERAGEQFNISLEAEGFKKLAVIYRALEIGCIKEGSILIWDEPEANINPKLIPDLVEILLELSRNGVQIFIATHDYIFAKYFEVRRKEGDSVRFHSLFKTENGVKSEYNLYFRDLKENPIIEAFDELLDEVLVRNLGD